MQDADKTENNKKGYTFSCGSQSYTDSKLVNHICMMMW